MTLQHELHVKYPSCQICGKLIEDDQCYMLGPEVEAFDSCVCRDCMDDQRKVVRSNAAWIVAEDWEEHLGDLLQETPVKIEMEE